MAKKKWTKGLAAFGARCEMPWYSMKDCKTDRRVRFRLGICRDCGRRRRRGRTVCLVCAKKYSIRHRVYHLLAKAERESRQSPQTTE